MIIQRIILIISLFLPWALASAASFPRDKGSSPAMLDALSTRTGIPATELAVSLANCDASQFSMNLCAQREVITAEFTLQKSIAEKSTHFPHCANYLDRKIARWKQNRNDGCKTSSQKAYADGSLGALTIAQCQLLETVRMRSEIDRFRGCR